MDKQTIINGLKYWIEKHNGEDLLLAFQSVQELYEVLTNEETENVRTSGERV